MEVTSEASEVPAPRTSVSRFGARHARGGLRRRARAPVGLLGTQSAARARPASGFGGVGAFAQSRSLWHPACGLGHEEVDEVAEGCHGGPL